MQESTCPRARLWVLTAGMVLAGLTLAGCESAEDQGLLTLIEEISQLRAETLEVMERRIEFAKASEESSTPRNPFLVSTTAETLASQRELRAEAYAEELEKLRLALEEDAWETEFPETFMFGTDVQPGIVKVRLTVVSDLQHGGFTAGSKPSILGVDRRAFRQLDCEHDPPACRGRSVTLVGAGGWWPDPQLD